MHTKYHIIRRTSFYYSAILHRNTIYIASYRSNGKTNEMHVLHHSETESTVRASKDFLITTKKLHHILM